MYDSKPYFYGTGRRKHSVARVRVYANGTGSIKINGRDIDDYFGLETLKLIVRQPMELTDTMGRFDIECNVTGGGISGQAGAIRHGLSRALLQVNEEAYRPVLKKAGFLTRDPRMKERKKYGLKAARRAPQFSRDSCWLLPTVGLWLTLQRLRKAPVSMTVRKLPLGKLPFCVGIADITELGIMENASEKRLSDANFIFAWFYF